MDASVYFWFSGEQAHLHLAVDDCTGAILGAWFDTQETLNGYYQILKQILVNYGIPYRLRTDRRTVFEYKKKNSGRLESDSFTQFGYACQQLGIDLQTTSVPQAKGRVERMFRTLKSRLLTELRLEGATTIEQANEFLNSYIKKFNRRFALPIDYTTSVFESSPTAEKINLTLAILTQRVIDHGHCLKFRNVYYQPINSMGFPVYFRKGTSCLVIQSFSGSLFASVGQQVFHLEAIPSHARFSKNFSSSQLKEKPALPYVPPMTHPWKAESFLAFVKKQRHICDTDLPSFSNMAYSQEIFF